MPHFHQLVTHFRFISSVCHISDMYYECGNCEKAHEVKYFQTPLRPLSYVENPLNPIGFGYPSLRLSFKLTDWIFPVICLYNRSFLPF